MIQERLTRLRAEMERRGIDIYIVPTADFHESEYVGEHFKAREFITGFTGSAGTAVVTAQEAGLWTDARYFLQAERQLRDSTVTLYKMGEEGVPTLTAFLRDKLPQGGCLGFDGRVINAVLGKSLEEIAGEKGGRVYAKEDLVDRIWTDRPPLSAAKAWVLEEKYAGRSTADKLSDVRAEMKKAGATIHLLTSLYDIAWLLNLRGGDIDYVPVVLSYLALTEEQCLWFVQPEVLSDEVRALLAQNRVELRPYQAFYDYAGDIPAGERVLLDRKVCSYRLCDALGAGVTVLDRPNPSTRMKAVKNSVEIENIRAAHVKDAVAVCKFICWLKKNIGILPMTEISASDYLAARRAEQEGFLELSFETICSYGPHAAIVHYAATPETDIPLRPEGMLLVDSGGHYREGSTDITRTIALGPVTEEMRRRFTMVARSHLDLAMARFLYGCSGLNLDILARGPLWEEGLDYKHGTGHGVGYALNVHEGPNGFRWKQSPERSEGAVLEEGMVTTDEPGYYLEGQYGIRTESELLCRRGEKNEFGQFMYFENVTYVPIDRDLLIPEELNKRERRYLNDYHQRVVEIVSPHLTEEEQAWLRAACAPV
ncbi:MAG: aminopeptidase P family protein [Oscillospiraceae bacterium]|nr:aminopeptidase P family protein [Oscillospiraceae bacterium]